jgi:hypothetical protein
VVMTPQGIAEKGETLYKSRFKALYEVQHPGKYVAIDISSEEAFVADTPEAAIEAAQTSHPDGFFHLVKVGSAGVYRVGYARQHGLDRVIR